MSVAAFPHPTGEPRRSPWRTMEEQDADAEEALRHQLKAPALPVTEDSLAVAFAREHGEQLRYDHDRGKWYIWDGNRWARDSTGLVVERIRALCRTFAAYAARDDQLARQLGKAATLRGVESLARSDEVLAITSDAFDRDPMLLATPGGTVDLRTGELRQSLPSDLITKQAAVAPASVGDRPHRWLQFLTEACGGDLDLVRFLQCVAGYCLTGETKEHLLLFVFGPGGNGKSVFLNTIAGIMGEYAATAPMDTFTASKGERHPTDLAMLHGARLVTASETEEGRAWAESRIKQLTGGDPIAARFMNQNFFTYRPVFKLLIVGNHKPVLRRVDEAARRRFRLIPFVVKPREVDPDLERKLRGEWPAILRWMIEGCLNWQAEGIGMPEAVARATDGYFDDQDMVAQWLAECCDVDDAPLNPAASYRCLSAKLFSSWKIFCDSRNEPAGSNKAFSQEIDRRGFSRQRTKFGAEFIGVRVREGQDAVTGDGW